MVIEGKKEPYDPYAFAFFKQLAVTLLQAGKVQEASGLHRTCLERRKASLSESHEDTLQSASNLAVLPTLPRPQPCALWPRLRPH